MKRLSENEQWFLLTRIEKDIWAGELFREPIFQYKNKKFHRLYIEPTGIEHVKIDYAYKVYCYTEQFTDFNDLVMCSFKKTKMKKLIRKAIREAKRKGLI